MIKANVYRCIHLCASLTHPPSEANTAQNPSRSQRGPVLLLYMREIPPQGRCRNQLSAAPRQRTEIHERPHTERQREILGSFISITIKLISNISQWIHLQVSLAFVVISNFAAHEFMPVTLCIYV